MSFTSSLGGVLGIGIYQVFSSLFQWAHKARLQPGSSTEAQMQQAAQALADQVRTQWSEEIALRGIADTDPIAVKWTPADYELSDYTEVVGGFVTGGTDDIAALLRSLSSLEYHRLVILGPAGSGKTVLAVRLTLELLKTRELGDPVPVLLSLSSWDPEHEALQIWLQRRIGEDYSALRDVSSYGPAAIKALVDGRMLFPVLDGLDELPSASLLQALRRINQALPLYDGLIVTCKTDAFEAATRVADVVSRAAVIRPLPVDPEAVVTFLRNATSPADLCRWKDVFKYITDNQESVLTGTLSNPLMTSLAGAIYADRTTNPVELIDVHRFPDQSTIENHLLDELIPSLVSQDQARVKRIRSWDWDSDLASKWLSFLAQHLQSLNTYDFSWWTLYRALPIFPTAQVQRRAFLPGFLAFILVTASYLFTQSILYSSLTGLAYGLLVGTACLLAQSNAGARTDLMNKQRRLSSLLSVAAISAFGFALPIALRTALTNGVSIGLLTGGTDGLVAGLVVVLAAYIAGIPAPPESPSRIDFHFRGRGSSLIRTFGIGFRTGILFGVLTGILAFFRHQQFSRTSLQEALASGVAVGLIFGIGSWLISWTRTPVKSDEARSPAATLRGDRTAVFLLSALISLTLGSAFGLTAGLHYDVTGSAANGLVGILVGLLSGAWPLYYLTSKYLGLRTRLPLSLMTFLDECHKLGILRQVGPVYQFRHAKLQERLYSRAGTQLPAKQSTAPTPTGASMQAASENLK